ncbi:hypothetical protein D0T50_09815 [Bacteroides sp. 214]|uniref:hypothetical protein n=1 Tax=Bacteroides sp. 214 TaxID=2302935 RepID=UPI0013CFCC81|nr:hypothetical protein [Bacteroides sp. 214]NDW13190.1 hypothetical protein [Bacteroides sp. 214]
MKVDLYTKVILTVIAFCMSVSLLKDLEIIPSAHANSNAAPSAFASQPAATNSYVDVRIIGWGGGLFSNSFEDEPLPVVLK